VRENNLWQTFKRNLKEPLWQRIETGGTGRGIPDVFGVLNGLCCWVELKVARGNKVNLSAEQVAWLIKFGQTGLPTFILVGTDKRTIYLFSGMEAREVLDNGLKHEPLLKLKAPYDWSKLQEELFNEDRSNCR
jgi:Holliday junction resolvase|tara:strand:+ start:788 stop:1186 length:399 start_codon:yes stop_codon:yes gene_type:complete